jgi:predicted P-loop ATPase
VPPDHDDDTWRFCVTLAASRAVVVELEEGDDNAPSGGGVPDPEIWALVRAPLPKGGWRVPPERDVVRTILEKDPRWAGRIKYDTLQYRATIDGKPPDDDYLAAVAAWMFRVYHIKTLSKDIVLDGLTLAARATPIDPVVSWLDDLPEWDGTPRLDTWIARYGRGVGDPDLLARYGRGFFVGLVARQYRPEVQADNVLTLWGEQGARKSTLLRSVVPEPDWFSDSRIDLEDPKRLSASLSGKVLVEWPELSAIRRSDAETVKSFLTSQRDRYVPMYGRVEVVRPRRVIFAATLNKNNAVPEAGRRWWVVEIAGTCDIDGLLSCRTQLWAEARAAYQAGATWHLPPEWEARQGRDVARFAVSDDWLELVRAYTAGGPQTGPKHLLDLGAIILRGGAVRNRADEARLQLALRQCGWSRDGALWSPP